jgi:hypothetical protein
MCGNCYTTTEGLVFSNLLITIIWARVSGFPFVLWAPAEYEYTNGGKPQATGHSR